MDLVCCHCPHDKTGPQRSSCASVPACPACHNTDAEYVPATAHLNIITISIRPGDSRSKTHNKGQSNVIKCVEFVLLAFSHDNICQTYAVAISGLLSTYRQDSDPSLFATLFSQPGPSGRDLFGVSVCDLVPK